MKTVNALRYGLASCVLLLLIGCAGFGKLQVECLYNCEQDVQSLVDNFDDFFVYYAGQDTDLAAAILFDPRDDDRQIRPGRWKPLKEPDEARHIIDIMEAGVQFSPKLYTVLGEQQKVYGYLYTPYQHVPVKQVAPGVVRLNYLPQPRHLQYDTGAGPYMHVNE